jgi:hypothetical protein
MSKETKAKWVKAAECVMEVLGIMLMLAPFLTKKKNRRRK